MLSTIFSLPLYVLIIMGIGIYAVMGFITVKWVSKIGDWIYYKMCPTGYLFQFGIPFRMFFFWWIEWIFIIFFIIYLIIKPKKKMPLIHL
jgi:hypothetical protein